MIPRFGLSHVGNRCDPLYVSFSGISLELDGGATQLQNVAIWQAMPTSDFYCPVFGVIYGTSEMMIGSMKIVTREKVITSAQGLIFRGQTVIVMDWTKPKRGGSTERFFGGISVSSGVHPDGHLGMRRLVVDLARSLPHDDNPQYQKWINKICCL